MLCMDVAGLGTVNGLSVNWVTKHVYWTDEVYRTIELCEYLGNNRRVLHVPNLEKPRDVLVDPVNGYVRFYY